MINLRNKSLNLIIPLFSIIIILWGWYNVFVSASDLKEAVCNSYQNEQQNILKILTLELQSNHLINKQYTTLVEEIKSISKFIRESVSSLNYGNSKDSFSNYGEIWFIPPNKKSTLTIYPIINLQLDLIKYFDLNTPKPLAKHYKNILSSIINKKKVIDWYIDTKDKSYSDRYDFRYETLLKDKGVTLVAAIPFKFQGKKWLLGISTLLPKLMKASGAYFSISRSIIQMLIITIFIILLQIVMLFFSLRIAKLSNKLGSLKIEIDNLEKEQEVSNIVSSDYFNKINRLKEIITDNSEK